MLSGRLASGQTEEGSLLLLRLLRSPTFQVDVLRKCLESMSYFKDVFKKRCYVLHRKE